MDVRALWDFSDPEGSERRLRAAMTSAVGDEWLILNIQIGRSYGLRRNFEQARQHLKNLEDALANAGAAARAHYALEWGRTWVSAAHSAEALTAAARAEARQAFEQAAAYAQEAGEDGLVIDALHMLPLVETEEAAQLAWGEQALALATSSEQPEAQRWEASLRHNQGYTLHQMGQYTAALEQFERALALRRASGSVQDVQVARWMIAWTLRAMGRLAAALEIQEALAAEHAAQGTEDKFVQEELAVLREALKN